MPISSKKAGEIKRQHAALCLESAFPGTTAAYRQARERLAGFQDYVSGARDQLEDTGIAGTPVHYAFSFEVARWLAKKCPGEVCIDWASVDDTWSLDELLRYLIRPAEDEYFDSGYVSSRDWIDQARAGHPGTDFDWLMAQLQEKRMRRVWTQLYDAADIPLTWNLADSRYSKSRNAAPIGRVSTRAAGMRPRPRYPQRAIAEPIDIRRLNPRQGSRLVDVAMASLAVRHRETWHFNHANPGEVYLADVGSGVSVAVFGLLPEFRYPLETTMGFLILANGMPVGYGGSSAVFKQANTGISIFEEYRGSEAAFLWTQVMRVYHSLVGCTRFIANAYQFGANNDEALKSGAFWFYYRLGFRPVVEEVHKLAQRETGRIRADRDYRCNRKTLRRLASCDMHLVLPGAKAAELFDEAWLTTSSMLASRALGAAGAATHLASANAVAEAVARDLAIRNLSSWTPAERRAFTAIAPIVAAAEPKAWSTADKRSMRELLRAKGGPREARYAQLLCRHGRFLEALRYACRHAKPG